MLNISSTTVVTLLLSSAVISALASALLNGIFSRITKKDEYKNAYFTKVLDRRMKAYETIERLIASLKTALVDDDAQPFHILFSEAGAHSNVYTQIHEISLLSIWLSQDLFHATKEFSNLMYARADKDNLSKFGKQEYANIAKSREKMEHLLMRDMRMLHDVPAFLGAIRPDTGFVPLPTRESAQFSQDKSIVDEKNSH